MHRLLTRIALPGGTEVAYVYDSKGNRVRQTVSNGSTVVTKQYIVDYSVPLSRVLADEDEDDIVQASYCYGNDLLAMKRDGVGYYFYYDRLGSVRNVTDDGDPASVVKNYLYDGFGNVITATAGSPVNVYQFTGEEYDADPGLVYLRARYYDPAVGRFISRDPLLEQVALAGSMGGCGGCGGGMKSEALNIQLSLQDRQDYAYCDNDPANNTDQTGLVAFNPLDPTAWNPTNYCGASKSGPGPLKGGIWTCFDAACERHDNCLKNTKKHWYRIDCPNVWDCHINLIEDWRRCLRYKGFRGNPDDDRAGPSPMG